MQRNSGREQGNPNGSGFAVADNPNRSQQLSPENDGDVADCHSPEESHGSDNENDYACSEFSSLSFVQKGTPAPWVLWNRSFQDLVNSPVGIEQFRLYVDRYHPADNCMYLYLLIKGWKQKNLQGNYSDDAIPSAMVLYNGYVAPDHGAISDGLKKEAQRIFKERGARDLQEVSEVLGRIYEEAWRSMEGTLYREYLTSESYAQFVKRTEIRYEKELAEAAAIRAARKSPEPTPLLPVPAHSSHSSSPREPAGPLRRPSSRTSVALGHGGDCRELVPPPVPPREKSVQGGQGLDGDQGMRMVEDERLMQQDHVETSQHPVYTKTTQYSVRAARDSDSDTQFSVSRRSRPSSTARGPATQSKTYQALQNEMQQALTKEMDQMNCDAGFEEAPRDGGERQRTGDSRHQTPRNDPPNFQPEQVAPRLLRVIVERRESEYSAPQREYVLAQNDQSNRDPQASPYNTYNPAVRQYATASTVAAGDTGYVRTDHYQRQPLPPDHHPQQYTPPNQPRQHSGPYVNVSDTGALHFNTGYTQTRVVHPLHQKHEHTVVYQPGPCYRDQTVAVATLENPWVVLWKLGQRGDCFMTNMTGRKSLGNFKEVLPKKLQIGPCTKYYFRDVFEDIQETVWNEVKHDDDELPLYEGRITGLVEL